MSIEAYFMYIVLLCTLAGGAFASMMILEKCKILHEGNKFIAEVTEEPTDVETMAESAKSVLRWQIVFWSCSIAFGASVVYVVFQYIETVS